MSIQKKTLPTKSDKKTETTTENNKAGKPSTEVGSSDAVTPSFTIGGRSSIMAD